MQKVGGRAGQTVGAFDEDEVIVSDVLQHCLKLGAIPGRARDFIDKGSIHGADSFGLACFILVSATDANVSNSFAAAGFVVVFVHRQSFKTFG